MNRNNIPMYVFMSILLAAIGISFYLSNSENNAVERRVAKVESPCLKYSEEKTKKNKRLCEESFEKAVATITHPQACAIERKAGTLRAIRELATELGVTFEEPCAGARLRQEETRADERDKTAAGPSPQSAGASPTTTTGVRSTPADDPDATEVGPPAPQGGGPSHPGGGGGGGGGGKNGGGSHGGPSEESESGSTTVNAPSASAEATAPASGGPPAQSPAEEQPPPKDGIQVTAPLPVQACIPPLIGVNCK
jgi:hypothetical protein